MNIVALVKKEFEKFGLSEKSVNEIANLVKAGLPQEGEQQTQEVILEHIKRFEPIAKSFQSEIERRVSGIKKEQNGSVSTPSVTEPSTGADKDDVTSQLLQNIVQRLESIEKGKAVETNNQLAIAKLKELKLSDNEIQSVMYGRNFETAEQVTDFVEKQSELYKTITEERIKANAGNGFNPMSSNGQTKKSTEQDIEEFNKQF